MWLVVGVDEREPHGATIYNTVLYFAPDGELAGRHRKLMPTGAERTVWGMGDGSTLAVVDAGQARIGGLICWENYMPLPRFHLYAQGIDLWLAPTLAPGDGWIATLVLDLDLQAVAVARRHMDPVGHYHRPDIFRLNVDTSPRPAVTELNR